MANNVCVYEMEMTFSASVGFREINDILHHMGMDDSLQIRDALTISVKEVLPCIPDEDYLRLVAQTIKDHYATEKINLTECRFTGYKYIREIKREGVTVGA